MSIMRVLKTKVTWQAVTYHEVEIPDEVEDGKELTNWIDNFYSTLDPDLDTCDLEYYDIQDVIIGERDVPDPEKLTRQPFKGQLDFLGNEVA